MSIAEKLVSDYLPISLYHQRYAPIFSPPGAEHGNTYALGRVIANADYCTDVHVSTMHVSPLDQTGHFWNHPAIVAMLWIRCVRACNVWFLFQNVTRGDTVLSGPAKTALTAMLDMFGVAWEEFEKGTSPIPVGHRPNHCKFVLLQRTITQGTGFPPKFFSVVAQSSGNLYHNATLSRQDTLITHGGGEIYNAYRRGFEALFSGVAPYSVTHASDGQTGVFFVPSRRAVDNLSSLCEPAGCCDDDNCCACTTDCSFENPFSWHLSRLSEDPPPWIFLAVGHAVPCCDLSQEIIRHLYKFHVSGAYVRVAVGNAYASFKAEMDKMGESLGVSPIPTVLRNIHNKYLVTLGKTLVSYDADNPQDQSKWSYATRFFVLTGSLNIGKWEMADSVLMCDTSFFGGSTWAEYRDDFDSLWEGD